MKIRIEENVDSKNFDLVMNIASIICMGGYIASDHERGNPKETGRFWYLEDDSERVQLAPIGNNDWAHVVDKGLGYTIVSFNFRYDNKQRKEKALLQLLISFLDFIEIMD